MSFSFHNSRFNGPKRVRRFDPLIDEGFSRGDVADDSFADSGGGITEPPQVIITPATTAQELAGGFTPGQLDLASRIETQQGAGLGFFYGDLLFGATNVVSHKYEAGVPRNTFTVVHGEGEGGLGRRGRWKGPKKVWYLGEELTSRYDSAIYFDDFLPTGSAIVIDPQLDGWNWVTRDPTPYTGRYAHQSPNIAGFHYHQFSNASQKMSVQTGDTLYCFIWIDPTNTPTEVMLQWWIGGGTDAEHRAYWGANSITLGTDGTNSRRQISASVPTTGQWVRLDVLASQVGLEGQDVDGMAFILFGGSATWDQTGRYKNTMSGNTGYVFRPGTIAPDAGDITQAKDVSVWPSGTANNGAAAMTVRLNTTQSAQDRPDGYKARIECRYVPDYDATGAEIFENYGYSTNPACVAADRMRHFFERRYRNNLDLAYQKFRARVHWPSWVAWRDYCDQLIPWDKAGDGVSVFIKRFEANIGFRDDISVARVLDQLCGLSATIWQDTGLQIVFLLPNGRQPVHHFTVDNVVVAAEPTVIDLRKLPNRFLAKFRDTDDEALGITIIETPDNTFQHELRIDSRRRVGEIRSEREFANMNQSQARRVLEYWARLGHDNPFRCSLVGNASAYHVLKGDYVTVTHPVPGWTSQLCLVLGVTIRSAEASADEIVCNLQRIDGDLYDDTAHRPRQEALTL